MGYAKYVGRIGALAVALGIGVALVGQPQAAWAEDEGNPTPDTTSEGTTPDGGGNTEPSENSGPTTPNVSNVEEKKETTGGTTTVTTSAGNAPKVRVSSSGGALISEHIRALLEKPKPKPKNEERQGSSAANAPAQPVVANAEHPHPTPKPKPIPLETPYLNDNVFDTRRFTMPSDNVYAHFNLFEDLVFSIGALSPIKFDIRTKGEWDKEVAMAECMAAGRQDCHAEEPNPNPNPNPDPDPGPVHPHVAVNPLAVMTGPSTPHVHPAGKLETPYLNKKIDHPHDFWMPSQGVYDTFNVVEDLAFALHGLSPFPYDNPITQAEYLANLQHPNHNSHDMPWMPGGAVYNGFNIFGNMVHNMADLIFPGHHRFKGPSGGHGDGGGGHGSHGGGSNNSDALFLECAAGGATGILGCGSNAHAGHGAHHVATKAAAPLAHTGHGEEEAGASGHAGHDAPTGVTGHEGHDMTSMPPTGSDHTGHDMPSMPDAGGGHSGHEMPGGPGGTHTGVEGLAESQDGYTFVPLSRELGDNFAFTITGPGGLPVDDYEILHDRELHLIVASRDLKQYAHLHPRRDTNGQWSVPLSSLPSGDYRMFADFKPVNADEYTLGVDVTRPGRVPVATPLVPSVTDEVDGFEVNLEVQGGEAIITARRDGQVVTTEPYLGAAGHLVALRDGDLAYLHVHPMDDKPNGPVKFAVDLPSGGTYALFFDFKVDGVVRTARFVVEEP